MFEQAQLSVKEVADLPVRIAQKDRDGVISSWIFEVRKRVKQLKLSYIKDVPPIGIRYQVMLELGYNVLPSDKTWKTRAA